MEKKSEERDSIDFKEMKVSTLFRKILVPTVLGMVFSAVYVITDGIFIGRGVGSDALAAINLVSPVFFITTGLSLMFGMGGSVVASIHLGKNNTKAANINMTQSLLYALLISIVLSVLTMVFQVPFVSFLGCEGELLPMGLEYIRWFVPFLLFMTFQMVASFFVRLDGAPGFAMMCNILSAIVNIILDYIFIFKFGWGLKGAAFASSIGAILSSVLLLSYLMFFSKTLRFYPVKWSKTSIALSLRNGGYMMKIGFPALLGEIAISVMVLVGNYVFLYYTGKDGVAAFSIVCYIFPIVFMVFQSIVQSAQPIIGYNFGSGRMDRVKESVMLALKTAGGFGIVSFLCMFGFGTSIVGLFLTPNYPAYDIAVNGLPYFSISFFFFAINLVVIGYLQSIEKSKWATCYTLLRGIIFVVISFLVLPLFLGVTGIWLAVPAAEILTLLVILLTLKKA